ncbi:MAG: hypothetical protein ABIR26_00185 [Ramlibacter sp.]
MLFFSRRTRFLTVIFSLCAMLLAQAALAGYTCPGADRAAEVAATFEAQMPCAEAMSQAIDEQEPVLCHAHCQAAQQTAEHPQVPTFAGSMEIGAVLSVETAATPQLVTSLQQEPLLHRATSPPVAVRHCCFRL